MRTAYFDCFAGISGDMTLGALIDAGADEDRLTAELTKLEGVEFGLETHKVARDGIQATDVHVITKESHHHRRLKDIVEIIRGSGLSETVKTKAVLIFEALAEAEGRVHGTGPEDVHFHEVGAVDAIVDIVGSCILVELLGIEQIISSALPMGHGFVEAAHGKIPLPAPATVELLKGLPIYDAGIQGELVTPTGAALLRGLSAGFGKMPRMSVESVGYGSGKTSFPFPNVLRVLIGETCEETLPKQDTVAVVETNIDDMNPEFYDSLFDKLFAAGALDVYLTQIQMKKSRPATLLSVVCCEDKTDAIARAVFAETSTFGVRMCRSERQCLDRKWEAVCTRYGDIRIKIGLLDGKPITASPEYEDCRRCADSCRVAVRQVYEEALNEYWKSRENR